MAAERSTHDPDRELFKRAIRTLQAEIANVGAHWALDGYLRQRYAREGATLGAGIGGTDHVAQTDVLGVDARRSDVARLPATFAGMRRIERQRDEAALRHGLGIQPRALFFHRAERAAAGPAAALALKAAMPVPVISSTLRRLMSALSRKADAPPASLLWFMVNFLSRSNWTARGLRCPASRPSSGMDRIFPRASRLE